MSSDRLLRVLPHVAFLVTLVLLAALARQYRALAQDFTRLRASAAVLNPGDALPAIRTLTDSGRALSLGDPDRGERQILFFLTKACQFCRATIPAWRSIAQTVRDSAGGSITVIAVAGDSAEQIPDYLKSFGLSVPVVGLPDRRSRKLFRAGAVPQTVVVGDSGFVLYARTGQITTAVARDSVIAAAMRRVPRQAVTRN